MQILLLRTQDVKVIKGSFTSTDHISLLTKKIEFMLITNSSLCIFSECFISYGKHSLEFNETVMGGFLEKEISEVPYEILIEQFSKPQYVGLFVEQPQNYKYYEFTNLSQLREYATVGHSHRK